MKKILILAFVLAFFAVTSCDDCGSGSTPPNNNNNSEYTTSDGLILGADYRECVCCGGWFVEIKSDTLRIFNMPSEFNEQLLNQEFPVSVRLEWKDMEEGCGEAWDEIIEIKSIEMR